MCAQICHRHFSEDAQWRIGYNNGYCRRPPHFALVNEPSYYDGYCVGIEDRQAGITFTGEREQ